MTSAYDLPSVQTLGEGEDGSQTSGRQGEEYVIAEVKFSTFKQLAGFGGKSNGRQDFKSEKKNEPSFTLIFNVYINSR